MRTITRLASFFLVAAIALAVWRQSGGDLSGVVDMVWSVLNQGADIVITVWTALTENLGSTTPAPTQG